jgi:hypothetical protein
LFLAVVTDGAIENGGRDSHLRQLRSLILHQGDQRGDYYCCASRHYCRELVAEGLASSGWHDHTRVTPCEEAADDFLLERAERAVSPVLLEGGEEIGVGGHEG